MPSDSLILSKSILANGSEVEFHLTEKGTIEAKLKSFEGSELSLEFNSKDVALIKKLLSECVVALANQEKIKSIKDSNFELKF